MDAPELGTRTNKHGAGFISVHACDDVIGPKVRSAKIKIAGFESIWGK